MIKEKIIVTLTSWIKRINNVIPVLECITHQTIRPNTILLNLCTEDFPNMEEDLPEDLLKFINDNDIKVFWFIENYKSWKKHLHALDIADDNSLIICIDDDHYYQSDFIEKMYQSYIDYDKKFPITYNRGFLMGNVWSFSGSGTLYRKSDWGDYKKYLTKSILHDCIDDYFINILFAINNINLMPLRYEYPNDLYLIFNDINPISVYNESHTYEKSDYDATNDLVNSSIKAIEETLSLNYFKNNTTPFTPSFWGILVSMVNNLSENLMGKYPELDFMIDIFNNNYLGGSYKDFDIVNKLNLNRKLNQMKTEEPIIVSMTSWHKRIGNVASVVRTILNQTIKPNKIIINLCTEDFPNMEEDLPDDLLDLINKEKTVELYWFIENYVAWKKHLHALEVATDDTLIISVDDDHLYPTDFIENLYVSYCYYNKKFPVTVNKIMLCHNLWTFNGPGTLYRKSDWGNYKKYLTYDVLHHCMEDIFITILFALNNILIMPEIFHLPDDKEMLFNDNDTYTDKGSGIKIDESNPHSTLRNSTLVAMENSLKEHYFKDRKALFTPSFWEIIGNAVDYYKKTYPNPPIGMKYVFEQYEKNYLQGNLYGVDFRQLDLDIQRSSRDDLIGEGNKLIITVSSWPRRISNVAPVIKRILYNSIQPDEIVINLAKSDFNVTDDFNMLKENSVVFKLNHPELIDLFNLMETHKNIYIHWYDDAELKSWKKHLYVVNHYSPDDVIICIDDDILYSEVFIETMLKSYKYFNKEFPITSCGTNFCQGGLAFHGSATLYRPKDFGDFNSFLNEKIVHFLPEDNHLLNIMFANNVLLMPVIGYNYLFKDKNFNQNDSNFGNNTFDDNWWGNYNKLMEESSNILKETCKDHPAMKLGWNPLCYRFSYIATQNYLEKYKNIHTTGYAKDVYDSIKNHFETEFGGTGLTGFDEKFNNVIL